MGSGHPKARRSGVALLIVALAASIAANVVLLWLCLAYFRAASEVRLDPAGLGAHAADRAAGVPAGRPVLVLFGDSRAAMWPAPRALTDYAIVNRGIARQTTAEILLRVDADVAPLHPAIVVLEAGVNDLKAIADLPGRRAEIVAGCEANLRRIVERCRTLGAVVVVTTVFAVGDPPLWRRPLWSNDVAAAVREVNAFLPTLCGEGVVLFDATDVLDSGHGQVNPTYALDFLHLTPEGYAALDDKLVPLVRSLPAR